MEFSANVQQEKDSALKERSRTAQDETCSSKGHKEGHEIVTQPIMWAAEHPAVDHLLHAASPSGNVSSSRHDSAPKQRRRTAHGMYLQQNSANKYLQQNSAGTWQEKVKNTGRILTQPIMWSAAHSTAEHLPHAASPSAALAAFLLLAAETRSNTSSSSSSSCYPLMCNGLVHCG
jgi:hypothetical protein